MAPLNANLVLQLTTGFAHTVVNAATATGLAKSIPFAVQQRTLGEERRINIDITGTFSVGTLQLQQSMDAGNSFQNVGSAVDVAATKGGDLKTLTGAAFTPGAIYQFSVGSITGTSITAKLAIT